MGIKGSLLLSPVIAALNYDSSKKITVESMVINFTGYSISCSTIIK